MVSNKEFHYHAGVEFENHLNNLDVLGGIYLELQKLEPSSNDDEGIDDDAWLPEWTLT